MPDTSEYKRVRHVPASSTKWHKAKDNLEITEAYNEVLAGGEETWSKTLSDFEDFDYFNEFLFASGDKTVWMRMTK